MKIILLIILAYNLNAQMSSGYFVEPNELLDDSSNKILKSKISTLYSDNGIEVTQYYNPIVTVISYNEYEITALNGMRKTYTVNGSISLKVVFSGDREAVLSTISFDVNGVGTNERIARLNALKSMKVNKKEIENFVTKTNSNYKKSIVAFTESKLREAKGYIVTGDYEQAVNTMMDVPVDVANKAEITKIFKTIEEKIKLKEEQEQNEKNRIMEMQFQLIKAKIESDTKLNERLIQENKMEYQERLAEERYLKMWLLSR